jgi:acetylornithine deacetylase/succinyl-diaminopimelate desuccinylase-like protein
LAFVGEPSRLEVITAHKGLMVFALRVGFTRALEAVEPAACRRLICAGRAAHSSTPALGRNAILLALETLGAQPAIGVVGIRGGDAVNKVPATCEMVVAGSDGLPAAAAPLDDASVVSAGLIPRAALTALTQFVVALQDFADRAGTEEPGYAPPTLTCNPGRIISSDDALVLDFELRPPPGLALDVVREGVGAIAARVARDAGAVAIELDERRANPGFRSALDRETLEVAIGALARAGLPLHTGVKAGCTEAGVYAAAGLEPVVFGPGPSTGVIHAPNEYNLLEEVEAAIRLYREVLRS